MNKQILIYDKKNMGFSGPKTICRDYMSLKQQSVLGGEDTLSFSVPIVDSGFGITTADLLQTEDFVAFEGMSYVVKQQNKIKNDQGLYLELNCEGLYTMLIDFMIDGDDTWLQGASMSTVLTRILRGTPFSLGRCDDFGTWDIELGELNCLEAINTVRENWPKKAEIYFDGYTLHAVTVRGNDTGYQLHHKKNILDIERVIDTSNLVTRLVGLGQDGMTIEGLDAATIPAEYLSGVHVLNGKVSKKYIDAANIGEYAVPKMYKEDMSDYTDQLSLLKAMQKYLSNACIPQVTYTITFSEMARQNVPYSAIGVGDFVYMNDPDYGCLKLRVAEIDRDPLYIENSTVTLGERQKTLEDYLSDYEASKDIWESFDPGMIDNKVEAAIKDATNYLNNGQNTCWITENDGIICADRTTLGPGNTIINTTQLVKMASGRLGCSNDGGQSYRSAITPEGVVADTIIGGTIHSSHIEIGDESKFHDGYAPLDVRAPLITEFDMHKLNTSQGISSTQKEINVLNTSVAQTQTVMNHIKAELQDNIDILNRDVSGLNGDFSSLTNMYNKVNSDLYGNSYFRWTEQGIHATDYEYPSYQMQLGAKGIGFSTDGGHIFNNAITARGIVASQVNIGSFNEAPFKGLTIHNGMGQETLAVDTNGNISLMGNINMNGGVIDWQNVSKMPYDALDDKFKDKFTFIDSNGVYTGLVKANQVDAKGLTILNAKNQETLKITSDGEVTVKGSIHMGPGSIIDWGAVGAPTAEQIGAMTDKEFEDYKAWSNQRFTNISATGIYTGTIDAGKIVVTGPKIPLKAVDITAEAIGAATQNDITQALSSANNYTKTWADSMSSELSALERDMVTSSNVTTITHNAIKTAKISANQILGGAIAGVKMYCDDVLCIGRQSSPYNPRIEFEPGNVSTVIEYRNRGGGYLAIACEKDVAIWGRSNIYMQTKMHDVKFSKYGSQQAGTGTYISMGTIVDKINELCKKAGISQI